VCYRPNQESDGDDYECDDPANREPLISRPETMRYALRQDGLVGLGAGAGCMRLTGEQETNTALVSRAIELGINYFETTGITRGTCQNRTAPA